MDAVRCIDDLLPTAALDVALATLEEIQRGDGLKYEMIENAQRMKSHTLFEEGARHQHVYIYICVVERRCWRMKTSLTSRNSFEPNFACPTLVPSSSESIF